jgi:hypothetical protein
MLTYCIPHIIACEMECVFYNWRMKCSLVLTQQHIFPVWRD